MRSKICVYCSSSDAVPEVYFDVAEKLGTLLAQNDYDLVYGGGAIGLMGQLARSVQKSGGHVHAVMPEKLHRHGIAYLDAEEMIVTKGMRERKAVMEEKSSAFIALPGGFGTIEEIFEILTLKQLAYHEKPVVFININDFFAPILRLCKAMEKERFIKPDSKKLFYIASGPEEALEHIRTYIPPKIDNKWFDLKKLK